MKLPDQFIVRMSEYFTTQSDSDADAFWKSFEEPVVYGIRLNRSKVSCERETEILSSVGKNIAPVPWCLSGYYTDGKVSGNNPYSHAGLFYQQEPSAMLPAEVLAVKPGEIVLDLCAAPGGKTTRIAEMLRGEGLLIANDISSERCRALLRNLERMGIGDAVILNETPEHIADRFPGFFEKILIDAPCSGEGMFRRDPSAVRSWERYGVETTVKMQRDILLHANRMLAPGGSIVYSTCTFSEEENEKMAEWFLGEFEGYEIVAHPEIREVSFSTVSGVEQGAIRIWPHRNRGEGHFCIQMRKKRVVREEIVQFATDIKKSSNHFEVPVCVASFFRGLLTGPAADRYLQMLYDNGYRIRDRLHYHSMPIDLYHGLKAEKIGTYCGDIKDVSSRSIFVPSSSLALLLNEKDIRPERLLSLDCDDRRTERYLKGETVFLSVEEGQKYEDREYIVVCVNGYPLGFAKYSEHSVKNHYPKSWRVI